MPIATTPKPPYYAVIFTSIRRADSRGYDETAQRMLELASQQPGFLGFESARQDIGISISYWASLEAIQAWKENPQHRQAQNNANNWYSHFTTRVCRVEKAYDHSSPE